MLKKRVKRIYFTVMITFMMTSINLVSGSYLIDNGGFESNFSYWDTTDDASISTTIKHSGSKSAMLDARNEDTRIGQEVNVWTANIKYLDLFFRRASGSINNIMIQVLYVGEDFDYGRDTFPCEASVKNTWYLCRIPQGWFLSNEYLDYVIIYVGYLRLMWVDDVVISLGGGPYGPIQP